MMDITRLFVGCLFVCTSLFCTAQTTYTINANTIGSQTFDVSGGTVVVTGSATISVRIQVWGAGGGGCGGIVTSGARPSSGGGGGGYTDRDTTLTAGTYTLSVGAGGGLAQNGGSSNFNGTIVAGGGTSVSGRAGGSSIGGTGGTGDYIGGSGASAGRRTGGGGGEGACTNANGSNGSGASGGTGCDGGDGAVPGQSATSIGGGGGGSTSVRNGPSNSGTGGNGQVVVSVITFLPVDYVYFDVQETENEEVELNWQTASELNNDIFEIERSVGGSEFQRIGSVLGSGTTSQLMDYSYTDFDRRTNQSVCYRLRQIDYDGTTHISSTRCAEKMKSDNITVYPNPFKNQISLSTPINKEVSATISDLSGRIVNTYVFSQNESKVIHTSELREGVYILNVNGVSQRIVKY